ncbi:DUF4262 domain-containing protein [Micromonospora sp. NPDC049366]|uniref:DUF4262 domain-containing protein n=1 Tax=Micromonospora sp. NPDC049366 TaxID=3364271 RepID=UPI00379D0746
MTPHQASEMEARLRMYLESVEGVIREHGWMVQFVFPTENEPGVPFAYTVGLTAKGRPELVIAGLPDQVAGQLLNMAAEASLQAPFEAGQTVDDLATVPFRVVTADLAEVGMARNLYGDERVSALQLVWPARNGAFPWEPTWPDDTRQPVYTIGTIR